MPRSGGTSAAAVGGTRPLSLPGPSSAAREAGAAGGVAAGLAGLSGQSSLARAATASRRGRASVESRDPGRARKRGRERAAQTSDEESEGDAVSVVSARQRARLSLGSPRQDASHGADTNAPGQDAAFGARLSQAGAAPAGHAGAAGAASSLGDAAATAVDEPGPAGGSADPRGRGQGSERQAAPRRGLLGLRLPGCRAAEWEPANGSAVVVAGSVRLSLQEAVAGSRIITGAGPAGEDGGDQGARRAVKLDVAAWWPLSDGDRAWLIGGALPPGPPGRKPCPRGMVRAGGADGAQRTLRALLERCQRQDPDPPAAGPPGAAQPVHGTEVAPKDKARSALPARRRDDDSSDDDDAAAGPAAGKGDGVECGVGAADREGGASTGPGARREGGILAASGSSGGGHASSALPQRSSSAPLLQQVAARSSAAVGALAGWLPLPAQPLAAFVLPVASLARLLQRARLRPRGLSARHPAIPCAIEVAGVTAAPLVGAGSEGLQPSAASWPLVGAAGGGRGAAAGKPTPWDEPRAISSREAAAATCVAPGGAGSPARPSTSWAREGACQSVPCPAPAAGRLAARMGFQGSACSGDWVARGHLWRFTLEGWALSSKGGGLALYAQRSAPPASLVLARRQLVALARGEDA